MIVFINTVSLRVVFSKKLSQVLVHIWKYFSVSIGSNIINVLLLYIIIYIRCCKTQDMMATASRLSTELETSTKILDRFSLEPNVSVPPNVLQQCIHKEDEVVKRLSNCNLTYLQPRAFAEWPMMKVRICTNVNNLWISILYFIGLGKPRPICI